MPYSRDVRHFAKRRRSGMRQFSLLAALLALSVQTCKAVVPLDSYCNACKEIGRTECKGSGDVLGAVNQVGNELAAVKSMVAKLLPGHLQLSSTGASCQQIKESNGNSLSGLYLVDPGNGGVFAVLCDMKTLGGGWTLVLNQINSNYYSLTDSYCSDLTRLTLPGRQCELERIFPHAKEILYTDIHGNPFLHAGFDGHAYWRALHSTTSASVPIAVRYLSGTLSGKTYNIEVNGRFHWGHRNYSPTHGGKTTAISKYPSRCQHVCWEDVAVGIRDRPFLGASCPSTSHVSFCPAFSPAYVFPSSARRGGSFKYRKWVR